MANVDVDALQREIVGCSNSAGGTKRMLGFIGLLLVVTIRELREIKGRLDNIGDDDD